MPRKCVAEGCSRAPIYNYKNEKSRLYCNDHKLPNMITVGQARCKDCEKYACFNYPEETTKLYCKDHSKFGMINVKKRMCNEQKCRLQAYFNYTGNTVGLFCFEHKSEDMINVYSKKCKECNKIASFGNIGGKAQFCADHKSVEMINVIISRCAQCNKAPSFAREGQTKPTHCATHKTASMINIKKKWCQHDGCKKTACFGNDGVRQYCSEHKDEDMKNLNNIYCQNEKCNLTASYGLNRPTHCKTHKTSEMTIKKGAICKICGNMALYNHENKPAHYCVQHKKAGMVNVRKSTCIEQDCDHVSTFGYPGFIPKYCAMHKKSGMLLRPTKQCQYGSCKNIAIFGKNHANYCEKHKQQNDVNHIEKKCLSCGLIQILNVNEKCNYCDPESITKFRLAKQHEITALFSEKKLRFLSTDKMVDGGSCFKYRPDFLFEADSGSHMLVVEVDENQHNHISRECEETRMINISQSLGMPTIFLRYNPDPYKRDGKTIPTTQTMRKKVLIDWVRKLLKLDVVELQKFGFLSVVYLFYDDYDSGNIKINTILKLFKEN